MKSILYAAARRTRRCRRGYLYVAVLFTALLISVATAFSLVQSTAVLRTQATRIDHRRAQRLAESELQRLVAWMESDPAWRNGAHQSFSPWRSLADGRVRHQLTDEDGVLNDDPFDDVTVVIDTRLGAASFAVSADLRMRPGPIDALEYRCIATDDLEINDSSSLICDGSVQASDDIRSRGGGSLATTNARHGGGFTLGLHLQGDRTFTAVNPTTGDPVAAYATMGTAIATQVIPVSNGNYLIEGVLLGPTANPFGAIDSGGVYRLQFPANSQLTIRNCRLHCLLVIESTTRVTIEDGLLWEHPPSHAAAILSRGELRFRNLDRELSETVASANFNPPHAPYRGVDSNSNTTDAYPSGIRGLVFSENRIEIGEHNTLGRLQFAGAVIGSDVVINDHTGISELRSLTVVPPLGMRMADAIELIPGSVHQIETPYSD